MRYLATLVFSLPLAAQICIPLSSCGGGGGGGGASATYQLTDFVVTKSGNTLVGSAGCTASTPCNLPIGGGISFTAGWTSGAPTGAGTIKIFAKSDGSYALGLPASGLTLASCTGCTATVGITQVPADGSAWYIYDWVVSGSAYAATGTDRRLFAAGPFRTNTQGAGITIAQTLADVSYSSSGGGYTPQFRPISSDHFPGSGCQLGTGWTTNFTQLINRPGTYTAGVDNCTVAFNAAGGLASYDMWWDGTTVLTPAIRWTEVSGTLAAVQFSINVACVASFGGSPSFSTVVSGTGTPSALFAKTLTSVSAPLNMGTCSGAQVITVQVLKVAAGSGGTVYTGNVDVLGMVI